MWVRVGTRVHARYAGLALTVVGHTDSQGTLDYNLDLSQRRAQERRRRAGVAVRY
jgi:outer membrane protein OmpA-like peptidoglycan-associated protein